MIMVKSTDKPIFMRTGVCLFPSIGALAIMARMRTNGKKNSASQDVNWALVTVIIVVI
jgi:hypothetical protein